MPTPLEPSVGILSSRKVRDTLAAREVANENVLPDTYHDDIRLRAVFDMDWINSTGLRLGFGLTVGRKLNKQYGTLRGDQSRGSSHFTR